MISVRTAERRDADAITGLVNRAFLVEQFFIERDRTDSETVLERLKLYTGWTTEDIAKDLEEKIRILQWLVKKNIENVDQIGMIMSKYYMGTLKMD